MTPASAFVQEETCPFKVTLYFLSFKKSNTTLSSLREMRFCFRLEIKPLCQTLSNAFQVSRKRFLTSNSSSKDLYFLRVIDKSWLIQESPGLKLNWFWGNQIVFSKKPEHFI